MKRLLNRFFALGLVIGLVEVVLPGALQAGEPEQVRFETVDGVEIRGTYYDSERGNKGPTVLLLHALGGHSHEEGWEDLAKSLTKKGFAVLTFDFRGHGESTNIANQQRFWLDPANMQMRQRAGRSKDQISYKDFTSLRSCLMMINDISAAKRYLDMRNDAGDCNSNNLVVIGAESAGVLGVLWIRQEWQRQRIMAGPLLATPVGPNVEGQDEAGAVWLSLKPEIRLGTQHWNLPLERWLTRPVAGNVPMCFLFGDKDTQAARYAKSLHNVLMAGKTGARKSEVFELTFEQPLKDAGKLSGRNLLSKSSLNVEDGIVRYVTKVTERKKGSYVKKEVDRTTPFRVPIEQFMQ